MRLVHLAGYASIAAVLATADWAGLSGPLLAAPLVLGTLYLGGRRLVERLTERAQENLESKPGRPLATDGGPTRREQLVDAVEEHGSGAVRDDMLLDELKTTGSDRNRSQN